MSRVDLLAGRPHSDVVRRRRARRTGWPPPEVAELVELSGQLLRAWVAVQGRHRPTLEDMELSDRLAAHVLAQRRTGRRRSLSAGAA